MLRRRILAIVAAAIGLGAVPSSSEEEYGESCRHAWVQGPFHVSAAHGTLAPDYFPYKLVELEHCIKCGLLRLPRKYRRECGRYLPDWAVMGIGAITRR